MESKQSSNAEDVDKAFHSKCKIDCGNGNAEGILDISPDSSTCNEMERKISGPVLQSKTDKLSIEYKVNEPQIFSLKFSNETDLESTDSTMQKFSFTVLDETVTETKDNSTRVYSPVIPNEKPSENKDNSTRISSLDIPDEGLSESKDNSTRISSPVIPEEGLSESKDNSTRISSPVIPDEGLSESKDNSTRISSPVIPHEGLLESTDNSTRISSPIFPDESSSENKTNLSRIPILEVSDETGLESKFWPLQIFNPDQEHYNTSSPLLFSPFIPSESASGSSFPPSRIFTFQASKNDDLSLEKSESFFKFPEKSTRKGSKRERMKTVKKPKSFQLVPKDSQTVNDCRVVSLSQTKNIPIKREFSFFKTSGFEGPEETSSETRDNLTPWTNLIVPDVNASQSKERYSNKRSLVVFGEAGLENEFSSLQITNTVNPDDVSSEINSNLSQESSLLVSDKDFETTLRTFYREIQSSLKVPGTSPTTGSTRECKKAVKKKARRRHSPSNISKNKGNYFLDVSPIEPEEIRIECEDYSPRIVTPPIYDEAASKYASLPRKRVHKLDEDTLKSLAIPSSNCLYWLPILPQRLSGSILTTEWNENGGRNLKISKSHPKSSLGDNPVDISMPCKSKVFSSAKSTQISKSFQGERDTKNQDNIKTKENCSQVDSSVQSHRISHDSRRNNRWNQDTYVTFNLGNKRYVRFPASNNPLKIKRSGEEHLGGNAQNMTETTRNQSQASFSKTDIEETNRNQSQASFSKVDIEETNRNRSPSGSRKTDNEKQEA